MQEKRYVVHFADEHCPAYAHSYQINKSKGMQNER